NEVPVIAMARSYSSEHSPPPKGGAQSRHLVVDNTRLRRIYGCRMRGGSQYLPLPQPARRNGAAAASTRGRRVRMVVITVSARRRFLTTATSTCTRGLSRPRAG